MLNLQSEAQLIRRIFGAGPTMREVLLVWLAFPDVVERVNPNFFDLLPDASRWRILSVIQNSEDLTEAALYARLLKLFPELCVNKELERPKTFDERRCFSRLFELRSAA